MTSSKDSAVPKIVDFGLSKIMGPNEKATEPFGTVGYVAPEILKKEPYSFGVDVWGLGCITYFLMTGALPFEGDCDKEINWKTVNGMPKFSVPYWKNHSNKAKDLVIRMLKNDPKERLTIS